MSRRNNREYFERLYAQSPDPWSLETSSYERKKYERTLDVLKHRRYHRALEVGCSVGVFTTMLASLCDELLAVDISERAVATAKERLMGFPHVRVERRILPEETPNGPFDLIIASEVLYYLSRERVLIALRRFEEVLTLGGALLAVHYRVPSRRRKIVEQVRPLFFRRWLLKNRTLLGDEVHELLLKHTRLTNAVSLVEPQYRLDLFEASNRGVPKL